MGTHSFTLFFDLQIVKGFLDEQSLLDPHSSPFGGGAPGFKMQIFGLSIWVDFAQISFRLQSALDLHSRAGLHFPSPLQNSVFLHLAKHCSGWTQTLLPPTSLQTLLPFCFVQS